MGRKNHLHQRRAQAIAKKESLSHRQALIAELKKSGIQGDVKTYQTKIVVHKDKKPDLENFMIEIPQKPDETEEKEEISEQEEAPAAPPLPEPQVPQIQPQPRVPHAPLTADALVFDPERDIMETAAYPDKLISTGRDALNVPSSALPIEELRGDLQFALLNTDVVAIRCSTGTGKSTQVPKMVMQFLSTKTCYQGRVIVTEPRRIAAAGLAARLRTECPDLQNLFGHAVRGDTTNPGAQCMFVTEGVLLQMLHEEFMLKSVSVVILDEAHERSQDLDVVVALLSRLVVYRRRQFEEQYNSHVQTMTPDEAAAQCTTYPLKLVLMSATMADEMLENRALFRQRPVTLTVTKRQYPVAIHYEPTPVDDKLQKVVEKVVQIHETSGAGGILVFLSGQGEINHVVRQLSAIFFGRAEKNEIIDEQSEENDQILAVAESEKPVIEAETYNEDQLHTIQANGCEITPDQIQLLKKEYDQMQNTDRQKNDIKKFRPVILPLHGQLSIDQQKMIYQELPEDHRLIIVATNVAESSLTVPAAKFVVDACQHKRRIETAAGRRLAKQFCSVSSLVQRAGRAGRVCAGHCFRLITPGQIGQLETNEVCEMQRLSIEGVLLQIMGLGITNINSFQFPGHPGVERLAQAMKTLENLCCITKKNNNFLLTAFGADVSTIPIDFRPAVLFAQQKSLIFAIAAAALSVDNIFKFETEQDYPITTKHGDFIDKVMALGAYLAFLNPSQRQKYLNNHNFRPEAFKEMENITSTLAKRYATDDKLEKPTHQQMLQIKKALLLSQIDNLAVKQDDFSYQIRPVNIFDFVGKKELYNEELIQNPIIETAKVSRLSTYFKQKLLPNFCTFSNADVVLEEFEVVENKTVTKQQKATVFLNLVTAFTQDEVLEFTDLTPIIKVTYPSNFQFVNGQITGQVTASWLGVDIGTTSVPYPGKALRADNPVLANQLRKRAFILLLLKGDIVSPLKKINAKILHAVKADFTKALPGDNKQLAGLYELVNKNDVETLGGFLKMMRVQPAKVKLELRKAYSDDSGFEQAWTGLVGMKE